MASVALFLQGKQPFDEKLRFLAADRDISLLCFLEVEVILKV